MNKTMHYIVTNAISVIAVLFYVGVKIETIDRYMSTETLKKIGYNDINITGFSWLGCNIKYTKRAKFIAKDKEGMEVTGSVCGDIYETRMISIDGND